MHCYLIMSLALLFITAAGIPEKKNKPVIHLVGDSTVKNGSGLGEGGLWGWGAFHLNGAS